MTWARGIVAVVGAGAIGLSSLAVGAQTPPTSQPAGIAPPPTSVAVEIAPELRARLDEALVVVAEEAAVLDLLDAFVEPIPPPLEPLIATVEWGTSQSREELLVELDALDVEGQDLLAELTGEVELSAELTDALGAVDDTTRAQLEQSQPGLIEGGIYLSAIDDLVVRGGRAPEGTRVRVDEAALVDALDAAYAAQDDTGDGGSTVEPEPEPEPAAATTTLASTSDVGSTVGDSSTDSRTWLTLALGALVFVVLVGALVALRRARSGATGVQFDELLEVSRTLALARTRDDVERIAADEAARLLGVPAPATAAVVRRSTTTLELGHETLSGVLVPERLGDGLLNRVVETGQSIGSVVTHEPALRSLPAALAAVPIIGAGRVEGVILVVRTPDHPFSDDELGLLRRLGPIAAASLESARHADASTAASLTDALTGIGNRRKLELDLDTALDGATGPTALVMIDLDHFKVVNDTHGHPVGDALLRRVAEVLGAALRPGDSVYRYGGEEFALVLPATTEHDAAGVADRARAALERGDVDLGEVLLPAPTASLGVAATAGSGDVDGLGLIARADRALYRAKADGRNRVVMATNLDR